MTRPAPRPKVEDELAITELFARYYRALDVGDTEGYLDCYTVDGEAVEESEARGIEVCKGREEIRVLVLKFHDRADFPGHQHRFNNLIFNDLGDGTWEVLSYAMSTQFHLGQPPVRSCARCGREGRRGVEDCPQGDLSVGGEGALAVWEGLSDGLSTTPLWTLGQ